MRSCVVYFMMCECMRFSIPRRQLYSETQASSLFALHLKDELPMWNVTRCFGRWSNVIGYWIYCLIITRFQHHVCTWIAMQLQNSRVKLLKLQQHSAIFWCVSACSFLHKAPSPVLARQDTLQLNVLGNRKTLNYSAIIS